jgi:hypothetical protein
VQFSIAGVGSSSGKSLRENPLGVEANIRGLGVSALHQKLEPEADVSMI